MKVIPKSEEYFKSRELVPGEYPFVFKNALESISQAGNEMIKVTLKLNDINGNEHELIDYLLDKKPFDYKLKHACDCAGIIEKYNNGEINAYDFINKRGIVKLVLRKNKEDGTQRISVDDYIVDKNVNNNLEFDDNFSF